AVAGPPGSTSTAASCEPVYDLTGALDTTLDSPPEPLPDYPPATGTDPRLDPEPELGADPAPDEPVYDLTGAAPNGSTVEGDRQENAAGADTGVRLLAAYAAQLRLAEPTLPWHTLRTPVADLGSALAFTAGALGKIAADVLVLSRTEIGEVAEARGGTSSAMPHKRNPVLATLIGAAARQAPALASVLLGALVAEDERPAGPWHAEWQPLRELLRLTGGAAHDAAELTAGLRVFPDRMRDNLGLTQGLLVSERLAAALTAAVGQARAKQLVAAAARLATGAGIPLAQALTESDPAVAELIGEARMRALTDPAGYTGSAGALVDRALAEHAEHPGAAPDPPEDPPDSPPEAPR
ncbi:lyase family protein, partial [Streptomyces niveus]